MHGLNGGTITSSAGAPSAHAATLTTAQCAALRAVNASAAALLNARYAQQQAQQQACASALYGNAHAFKGPSLAPRAAVAQRTYSAHTAAQRAYTAAQARHSKCLNAACALGLPRVQVPSMARALATRRMYVGA